MRPFYGSFFALACGLGVLLGGASHASAQPVFERLTRAAGLPSDYVLTLYQDRAGFLWFGTDSGVARYDGRTFRTFTAEDGLPDNLVYRFGESHDGTLYVATFGGLARFTGDGFASTPAWRAAGITTDVTPLGRHLLVQAERGLHTVVGDSLHQISPHDGWIASVDSTHGLFYARDGAFLVQSVSPEYPPRLTPLGRLPEGEARFAWLDPESGEGLVSLIDSTREGGHTYPLRLRGETLSAADPLVLPAPDAYVETAKRIDDGLIVGLNSGGVWLREDDRDRWTRLLDTPLVESILVDYEGSVWVGTFGQGVYRMRARHLTQHAKGRVVRLARDAFAPPGVARVFFSTEFGLWTYEAVSGGTAVRIGEPHPMGEARAIAATSDAIAVTAGASLRIFSRADLEAGRMRAASALRQMTEQNWWSGVAWVGDTLWASTYGTGVRRFHPDGTSDTLDVGAGIPSAVVEDLVSTESGLWMLSRSGGATCYRTGSFHRFDRETGLPSNAVYTAYTDARGATWLGTDRGAARLLPGTSAASDITVFAHPTLERARLTAFFERPEDPTGVWAVAGQTLVRFDAARTGDAARQPEAVRVYGGFALVPETDASVNAATYLPEADRLLLGTTGGLVAVDLSLLPETTRSPRVAFTGVLADGAAIPLGAHLGGPLQDALDAGRLGPRVRELAIAFAPLTFRNVAASGAEYRLDDGAWSDASQSRSVTLAAPAPGRHTITVRAIGPDGTRSAQPIRLTFTIVPTWWQTPWVLALLGLLGAVGIAAATRYAATRRYRDRLRRLEARHRVERERQRISRDLHDHVGAQLTGLIAGLDLAVRRPEPDLMTALRGEARDALGQLRGTVWALRHSALQADAFAEQIRRYVAEQQRFVETPTLHVRTDLAAPHTLTATAALNLLRIVQEALQNALKHAQARRVDVALVTTPGTIMLTIEDDGTFQPPSDASGAGLQHMRARAEEIGATFALTNDDGTRITVRLQR